MRQVFVATGYDLCWRKENTKKISQADRLRKQSLNLKLKQKNIEYNENLFHIIFFLHVLLY